MTPAQLAARECANWHNGTCDGVILRDDGRQAVCAELAGKRCAVSRGAPCAYFEQCVMGAADHQTDEQRARSMADARATYMRDIKGARIDRPTCALCGGERRPGCRYCPACAAKRRRKAHRDEKRRQRGEQ